MSRNIILCADGTGNKGGYTPDSNVYKTYNAIELHDPDTPQVSFYDNGVGTSTNKFLKAISAALGFGFQRNETSVNSTPFCARTTGPGGMKPARFWTASICSASAGAPLRSAP